MGAAPNALFDYRDVMPFLTGPGTTRELLEHVEKCQRILFERFFDPELSQVAPQFDPAVIALVLDGPLDGSPEAWERLVAAEKVIEKAGGPGELVPELDADWSAMLERAMQTQENMDRLMEQEGDPDEQE